MKALGLTLMAIGISFAVFRGYNHFIGIPAHYDNVIGNNWYMFDESSTIEDKAVYMEKYINSIDHEQMAANYGLFTSKPSNSLAQNMKALNSLRGRLNEIRTMNPNSFEYQTAITQITGQEAESNAAKAIEWCWEKENYYWYFNWLICLGLLIIQILLVLFGYFIVFESE